MKSREREGLSDSIVPDAYVCTFHWKIYCFARPDYALYNLEGKYDDRALKYATKIATMIHKLQTTKFHVLMSLSTTVQYITK